MIISQRLRTCFWIAFLIFPIATGALSYRYAPDEQYDRNKHELLSTRERCREDTGECFDRPETWKNRKTRQVFSRSDFRGHRLLQAATFAVLLLGYGLIGCAAEAYFKHSADHENFVRTFRTLAQFAAACSLLAFLLFFDS
jgi:hypothetical protein